MSGLKSFLFFNELSQVEVARFLGVSKSQMSKLVSGQVRLRADQLTLLLNNDRGWNTEFLTDGTWEKVESSSCEDGKDYGIPLIPVEAVAGYGAPTYDDIPVVGRYEVAEFRNSDFLVRVKGDSMSPKFTGGDLVACKRVTDMLFFQWGRVYVIHTQSQGVMIKRIQPSDVDGCVRCVSDNEKYAPFDVPKTDIVSLALVNGSISLE